MINNGRQGTRRLLLAHSRPRSLRAHGSNHTTATTTERKRKVNQRTRRREQLLRQVDDDIATLQLDKLHGRRKASKCAARRYAAGVRVVATPVGRNDGVEFGRLSGRGDATLRQRVHELIH